MNYFVIASSPDESHVYVNDIPDEIRKQYQLIKGISRARDWPADVQFRFSDEQPEGLMLTDFIENSFGWIVCSARLARIVEQFAGGEVELLPVSILNHKGRVASDDYFIANPLRLIRAVDRANSVFVPDPNDPDLVFEFSSLALDASALAALPGIFRLGEEYMTILVRADLARAALDAGVTGVRFLEPAKYEQ